MPDPRSSRIDGLAKLEPRRILCCQQRQIGDVLLLTPALRMLKRRYPEAQIDVFTEKKCAPALQHNPDINHIWQLDKSLGRFELLRFYRRVGTGGGMGRYDMVIAFQILPRIRWVLALSDAPVKLTTPPSWYNLPIATHWAPVSGPYAAKCKAGVVMNALGLPWINDPPRIYLLPEETAAAQADLAAWGLAEGQRLVTVDPTHRRPTRQWPAGHYARTMALAAAARPELCFLLLFGPGEEDVVRDIKAQAMAQGLPERSLILPPRLTTLREMAAIQSLAALHFGNCSSPRHFAVAVGTKTLTVRGSTSSSWTFPGPGHEDMALGLPCQPCDEDGCKIDMRCLKEMTPEAVLPRLLAMLED